jgi:hypothetical protein
MRGKVDGLKTVFNKVQYLRFFTVPTGRLELIRDDARKRVGGKLKGK